MEHCRSHDAKQYIRPLYFGEEKNLKNEPSTISDNELIYRELFVVETK